MSDFHSDKPSFPDESVIIEILSKEFPLDKITLQKLVDQQGAHSEVREVIISNKEYVAKIVTEDYTYIDKELPIAKICSDLKVGSKIIKTIRKNNIAIIIMEKYSIDLADYLLTYPSNRTLDKLMDKIGYKLQLIHNNGIIHGDFTSDNIMLNSIDDIVIIDYGCSYFSKELHHRRSDWNSFNYIQKGINQIKNGAIFKNKNDLLKAINPKCKHL